MADRSKRPSYVLTGPDIVEHIYTQQELEHQTRNYFHYSPLWRAIKDHISDKDRGGILSVILIDPPLSMIEEPEPGEPIDLCIKCYRGSGYAIHFKDAAIYGMRGEAENIELTFEVEWEACYESFTRTHRLKVPVTLAKNYSEEAFQEWLKTIRADKKQKQREADLKAISSMLSRNPTSSSLRQLYNEYNG
jgi:hypothetical protein